jgi:hypothetical protein
MRKKIRKSKKKFSIYDADTLVLMLEAGLSPRYIAQKIRVPLQKVLEVKELIEK